MRISHIIFLLSLFFIGISCEKSRHYKVATLTEGTTYYKNGQAIAEILEPLDIYLEILTDPNYGSYKNCQLLWENEVDFAFAQNDTKVVDFLEADMKISDSRIRTVIPVYPEILFVIYSDTINDKSLIDLVEGRRIGVGPENSGTSIFFREMLDHYGIDSTIYQFVYTPWPDNVVNENIDISVMLAGFHTEQAINMLEKGCQMYSFGNTDEFEKGSSVEGFCMNYQTARPYIVPQHTFGIEPKSPIVTIAVDAVLLCHKDIDELIIYKMVKEIYNQKNILTELDPLLGSLSDNFDRNILNFPLHKGTKMYLTRNEPTFIERYAEMIGVFFSIIVAAVGAGATLVRINKTKKKNRIDVYYQKLLNIENSFENDDNYSSEMVFNNVMELKNDAIKKLIKERLVANESFNIFLKLCEDLITKAKYKNSDNA